MGLIDNCWLIRLFLFVVICGIYIVSGNIVCFFIFLLVKVWLSLEKVGIGGEMYVLCGWKFCILRVGFCCEFIFDVGKCWNSWEFFLGKEGLVVWFFWREEIRKGGGDGDKLLLFFLGYFGCLWMLVELEI